MYEPEHPGLARAYWTSPKNSELGTSRDHAIRRILGMHHPTFANSNGVPIYQKKINEYKAEYDIDDDDLKRARKAHMEQPEKSTYNPHGTGYGGRKKRRTKRKSHKAKRTKKSKKKKKKGKRTRRTRK